ncbi:hypothetical protein [Roseomonas fluvialis]|nr:hypothetical protein [Roseomonas fluvialis]
MVKQIDDQFFMRIHAEGRTTGAISEAMQALNRMGIAVDLSGCVVVDGRSVPLRVQGGSVVALVDGTPIPWSLFKTTLKRKEATA